MEIEASKKSCLIAIQCGQHIRTEIGDPLFSFVGDAKIAQGILDVLVHDFPVAFGVVQAQVSGGLLSQFPVEADFLELAEEGRTSQPGHQKSPAAFPSSAVSTFA